MTVSVRQTRDTPDPMKDMNDRASSACTWKRTSVDCMSCGIQFSRTLQSNSVITKPHNAVVVTVVRCCRKVHIHACANSKRSTEMGFATTH